MQHTTTHEATMQEIKQAERQNCITNGLDPDVWCAPRPAIPNSAFVKCCAELEDAFRPERKQRQHILSQGHHVHALVEGKRYGFAQACRLMEVDAMQIANALAWLQVDNARLNAKFGTDVHRLRDYDFALLSWMGAQEAALPSADVLSMRRDNV